MNSVFMRSQVRRIAGAIVTVLTFEGFLSGVSPHVFLEVKAQGALVRTQGTSKRFLFRVC